jgi:hypothetical protein
LKICPPNPNRERTITKPVNALLLESAQAMDETADSVEPGSIEQTAHRKTIWKLALLTREGAEFVIAVPPEGQGEIEAMGTQPSEPLAKWTRRAAEIAKRWANGSKPDRFRTSPATIWNVRCWF